MHTVLSEEVVPVQILCGLKNKRHDNNDSEDQPPRKRERLVISNQTSPENFPHPLQLATQTTTEQPRREITNIGGRQSCPGLHGTLEEVENQLVGAECGKQGGCIPSIGPALENKLLSEESMDFDEGVESVSEECGKSTTKLFHTNSASARLSEVLKLESKLAAKDAKEISWSEEKSKETNLVEKSQSQMEMEAEKMPELFYYM